MNIEKFSLYSIVVGVLIAIIAYWFLPKIAKNKRRKKFLCKPINDFSEIYNKFYEPTHIDRDIAYGLHKALSQDVGVHPCQIDPLDNFNEELSVKEWWGVRGDEFEETENYLEEILGGDFFDSWPDDPLDYFLQFTENNSLTIKDILLKVSEIIKRNREPRL